MVILSELGVSPVSNPLRNIRLHHLHICAFTRNLNRLEKGERANVYICNQLRIQGRLAGAAAPPNSIKVQINTTFIYKFEISNLQTPKKLIFICLFGKKKKKKNMHTLSPVQFISSSVAAMSKYFFLKGNFETEEPHYTSCMLYTNTQPCSCILMLEV